MFSRGVFVSFVEPLVALASLPVGGWHYQVAGDQPSSFSLLVLCVLLVCQRFSLTVSANSPIDAWL